MTQDYVSSYEDSKMTKREQMALGILCSMMASYGDAMPMAQRAEDAVWLADKLIEALRQ